MLPTRPPTRRECLAAICACAGLATFGRAAAIARSEPLRVLWRTRADGAASVVVSGVNANVWRCLVFGPPCSRAELRTSRVERGSAVELELGELDAARYCVRVETADAARTCLALAHREHTTPAS